MNRLNQTVRAITAASILMVTTCLAMAQDADDSSLTSTANPSFDCSSDELSSIEKMVCQDKILAEFDQQLANIYQQAKGKVKGQMLELLTAEQRGWIKGRDECWKAEKKTECVSDMYHMRTAELQARFKLVDSNGPVTFECEVPNNNELSVTFYHSDPATIIASWQNSMSLMYIEPAASGAKYQGRNTLFWEHQGEAKLKWGAESPEFKCKKK
ncbi:MliC family protein [Neptunicella sp. SCSIO 80796]|uniref:MliC family protein n=1 Tax=Neptunicella plasticusilytica TaxID=3117012 RepID=UPI003A4D8D86